MSDTTYVHVPQLRTFGCISLGGAASGGAVQPKRLALLAYLAVAEPQIQRRDTLLGLFWPNADDTSARTNLRQALSAIRQLVSDDVIETRGDDIWISRDRFSCDMWLFEDAVAQGKHARAVELYRGPFLDGFYLKGCPEFESWVEQQRVRAANDFAAALEALASNSNEPHSAVVWWRRLAEHDPYSTRVALGLMQALEATGDRAGALRCAEQHGSRLRDELDAEPSPDVMAFAARLREHPRSQRHPPSDPELERIRGALIERYTIERRLGAGGMANVYLAEDLKHHRKVAVKVLKQEIGALIGAERFRREIEVAATLNHPHILTLIDSGEVDHTLYYVIPHVEGESLREALNRHGQLPIADAIRFTRQIASALGYAHRQHVIHRDIKPENVLIHEGEAMLTDFGIALAVRDADGERLTETGISLGTPHYMSPEQAAGDSGVDHRADIYALGVVAYEMVAGSPPFTGDSAQAVLSQHVLKTPELLCERRAGVSVELSQVVIRCLEKKADDRWQSGTDLVEVLDAIPLRGASSTPTTVGAIRKRQAATGVVGVLAIVALLILGWAALSTGVSSESDRIAVAVFENRTNDSTLDLTGERIADWITSGLHVAGTVDVVPWETARRGWEFVQSNRSTGQDRSSDPLASFGNEVDAGVVVSGAIYQDKDSIEIRSHIVDVGAGTIVTTLPPVRQPIDALNEGIDQVRQRVMGALAVASDDRLVPANPPTHEAYQIFAEGLDLYNRELSGAGDRLRDAFYADTTYLIPLVYASLAYRNEGLYPRGDSVRMLLEQRRSQLPEYYRYWVDYLTGRYRGDNEAALVAIRKAAALAPTSKAQYNRAFVANYTGRPEEALEALSHLDPDKGSMRGNHNYWIRKAGAYSRLGNYEESLRATREGRARHPEWDELAANEIGALAKLGRVEEMYHVLASVPRASLEHHRVMQGDNLRGLHALSFFEANPELGRPFLDSLLGWMENPASPQPPEHRNYIRILALTGRTDDALAMARRNYEQNHDYNNVGFYGALLAYAGQTEEARTMAASLIAVDWGPLARGWPKVWLATIAAQLGELDEAVSWLSQAFNEGVPRSYGFGYFLVQPLRDYSPFQQLTRLREGEN